MKEAYPRAEAIERERSPSRAKDWNDALRAQGRLREEERPEERERNPEHGPGRGGVGSSERDNTPGHRR